MKRCKHRTLLVRTEPDGCYWIECADCAYCGPNKHSRAIALVAFALATCDQHPRSRTPRQAPRK